VTLRSITICDWIAFFCDCGLKSKNHGVFQMHDKQTKMTPRDGLIGGVVVGVLAAAANWHGNAIAALASVGIGGLIGCALGLWQSRR